jgi:hypothetical protein
MRGFIRRGLTAGVLTVAVVAGMGGSAAAATRQPGEDPGGDPIERPTPTRPPTTPRQIESFQVSIDSVVATVTLHYNGDPSAATVLWGDGTSTSQCPAGQEGPLHSGCMPNPFDSGSEVGTLVLKHRYAAPADGAPFPVVITAKMGAESQTIHAGVIPRYTVTVSDIEFSPLSHCDTAAEEETEWHVERWASDKHRTKIVPYQEWSFDHFVTNPRVVVQPWSLPDFKVLPGSGFSVELTAADHVEPSNYVDVVIYATELDPVADEYLESESGPQRINTLDGSRSVDVVETGATEDPGCRAEFRYDVDVRLLAPGLDRGPVLGQ